MNIAIPATALVLIFSGYGFIVIKQIFRKSKKNKKGKIKKINKGRMIK